MKKLQQKCLQNKRRNADRSAKAGAVQLNRRLARTFHHSHGPDDAAARASSPPAKPGSTRASELSCSFSSHVQLLQEAQTCDAHQYRGLYYCFAGSYSSLWSLWPRQTWSRCDSHCLREDVSLLNFELHSIPKCQTRPVQLAHIHRSHPGVLIRRFFEVCTIAPRLCPDFLSVPRG